MKAKLKASTMGRPEGVYEVASQSTGVVILKDSGGEFVANSIDVELVDEPANEKAENTGNAQSEHPPEFVWPSTIVDRVEVEPTEEALARAMYDSYSGATGGVAYNGAPLPHSDEFFEDPRAQKQANAWRHVALNIVDIGVKVGLFLAGPGVDETPSWGTIDDSEDFEPADELSGSEDGSSDDPQSEVESPSTDSPESGKKDADADL